MARRRYWPPVGMPILAGTPLRILEMVRRSHGTTLQPKAVAKGTPLSRLIARMANEANVYPSDLIICSART